MKKRVSVIVPVYNVERFIKKCITSILSQTYSKLEIILVGDGSTDDSEIICNEFALLDVRVINIQIPSLGVSDARNFGLRVATGDYVMFVDSDDWIDDDTVQSCMTEFGDNPKIDCLLFAYVKEYEGKSYQKHIFETDLQIDSVKLFKQFIYRKLFGLANDELNHPERMEYLTTCWGKVYRRELVENFGFIDIRQIGSCEDGLFNLDTLFNCQNAVYLDKPFYHYRYTKGSLTLKYRAKLNEQWHRLFEIMQQIIMDKKLSYDFQEALNNRIALSILGIGINEMDNPAGSFWRFVTYINNYISSNDYRVAIKTMKLKKLPLPWKIMMLCCKLYFGLGVAICLKTIRMVKSKLL